MIIRPSKRVFLPVGLPPFEKLKRNGNDQENEMPKYDDFLKIMHRRYAHARITQSYIRMGSFLDDIFRIRKIGKKYFISRMLEDRLIVKEERWHVSAAEFRERRRNKDRKPPGLIKFRFYMSPDGMKIKPGHEDVEVELDVFVASLRGNKVVEDLRGLVIAEVRFRNLEKRDEFKVPEWLGMEITGKAGYGNSAIARYGITNELKKLMLLLR